MVFGAYLQNAFVLQKFPAQQCKKKQWFWYLLWWTFSNVGYVRVYIKRALFWATWAMRSARLSRWGAYHTRPRSVQVHRFKHMWLEQVSGNDVHCDELAGTAGNVVRDFVMCDEEAKDLWELDGTLPLHSSSWQSLLGTPLLSLSSVSQDLFFNKKNSSEDSQKILRRFSEDCFATQTLVTAYTPDRQICVLIRFFFYTICLCIYWWLIFCLLGGRRTGRREWGEGRRRRGKEWIRGSLPSPLSSPFEHSFLSICFRTFLQISQTVPLVVITCETQTYHKIW